MKRLLTSCFGLGLLPGAPGTFGSLPPTVIFFFCHYFGASAISILTVLVVLVLAGSVVCIRFTPAVIAATGKKDPREVVADEFAGQAAAFLLLSVIPVEQKQIAIVTILGFLLFRLFDIAKPWPIRKLEKLPTGWGILADDLLAGVYAGIVLVVCCKLWILWFAPL